MFAYLSFCRWPLPDAGWSGSRATALTESRRACAHKPFLCRRSGGGGVPMWRRTTRMRARSIVISAWHADRWWSKVKSRVPSRNGHANIYKPIHAEWGEMEMRVWTGGKANFHFWKSRQNRTYEQERGEEEKKHTTKHVTRKTHWSCNLYRYTRFYSSIRVLISINQSNDTTFGIRTSKWNGQIMLSKYITSPFIIDVSKTFHCSCGFGGFSVPPKKYRT